MCLKYLLALYVTLLMGSHSGSCREVSRDREKKRDQEDEEDAYERRKLERKLRDKEAAYQEVGAGKMVTAE